jgi:hypothetical protein
LEGSLGQWTSSANVTPTRDTSTSVEGAACLRVTSVAAGAATVIGAGTGLGPALPVDAGATYTFLCTARNVTAAGTPKPQILWYDASGASISTSAGSTLTASFTDLAVQAAAPATAAYALPAFNWTAVAAGEYIQADKLGFFKGTLAAGSWSAGSLPWKAQRPSSGRKLAFVDRTMLLLGTDDYLEILDHADLNFALTDSFTIVAVFRHYNVSANYAVIAKRNNINATSGTVGWIMRLTTSSSLADIIDDGTNFVAAPGVTLTLPSGVMNQALMVRNVAADQVNAALGVALGTAVTDPTTATLSNTNPMRIGAITPSASSYADMEFVAAAVFRVALTANDIAKIQGELLKVAA